MTIASIVVGVDGTEISQQALRWAIECGRMKAAPIEAVIAWGVPVTFGMPVLFDDADLKDRAAHVLQQAIREAATESVVITERVEKGHAGDVLVAASEHAQLLVVGVPRSLSTCAQMANRIGRPALCATGALPGVGHPRRLTAARCTT